ncbi:MAG: DMT family transporter [Deltaproteobacteria bacterium]|nr:DMT family transporter [Deltaproteobacteria bacterium]MBW2413700.1 DMT family transporter [Deltaproteobacteria bacterium]
MATERTPPPAPPESRARLLVIGAALLFSTGGTAIKLSALSAWQLAGFRSGIAAVLLWLLVPAWRGRPTWQALAVGCAYATTLILYVTANTLTTAANSIFLQTTAPLWVLLLAPLLLGEASRRSDLVVAGLIGGGLMLFFIGGDEPVRTAPDPLRGNIIATLSGISWALTLIGLRALARATPREGVDETGSAVVFGNTLAFAFCLPFAVPVGPVSTLDLGLVAYLGAFQIGAAYLLMVRGMRGLRALQVSFLLVVEPVASTVWAWAVHSELPSTLSLAGCLMVLMGLMTQERSMNQ